MASALPPPDGSARPPTVVVADDHPIYRAGLVSLLERGGIDVLAEAARGEQAVEQALAHQPDVIVMDLNMPGLSGVEATRVLRSRGAVTPVLVLTVSAEAEDVRQAILAGAAGYLLKDDPVEALIAGIRAAVAGDAVITPRVAPEVLRAIREDHRADATAIGSRLTPREHEVLALVAEGRGNADIAETLVISESTVRHHISKLLEKLGVENRVQAAVEAVRKGIVR